MENNRIIKDGDREVNLKVLFANFLRQWRRILLLMVLFCCLIIAYKEYKLKSSEMNSTENDDVITSADQKVLMEKQISNTTYSIQMLNNYISDSIYASIDPYNETETSVDIAIVTNSSADNLETLLKSGNHANQISQAYLTYILKNIDYGEVAADMNLNAKYINELVSAKLDTDTDTIVVSVIGDDSELTQKIANYVVKNVNNQESYINEKYGDHSIVISTISTNKKIDSTLLSTQSTASSANNYSNNAAMTQAIIRLNTLKNNLITEETSLKSIDSSSSTSSGLTPKALVKYGLIGMLGGLVVSGMLYALVFALNGKISTEDDVKSIYSIKILSVLPLCIANRKKLSKLDDFAFRKLDSAYGIGKDIAIEKAMMNISGYAGDKKSILLVGSDLKENLEELQKKLQELSGEMTFNISSNINADSNELAKLKNTDGVIVVAERNATRIDDLTKTVETIYNWKKEIIGSIVL